MDEKKIIKQCIKHYRNHKENEFILQYLKKNGLNIIQSIKIIRDVYKISLGEAKNVVSNSQCWSIEAKVADEFHAELLSMLCDGEIRFKDPD
jgi:ribosomal protein L7/L12